MPSQNNDTALIASLRSISITTGISVLALCLLSLFFSVPAVASNFQASSNQLTAPESRKVNAVSGSESISREEAIAIAKQGQDSKVLRVKKQQSTSGTTYKVKLLTKQGRVKQVVVNASTGRIEHKR